MAWWNTEHRPAGLEKGSTPRQAWEADPAPVEDVPEEQLVFFALEDDGRVRKITTNGVTWRRRAYIAPWMVGHVGARVRLRYLPHYDGEIEVFDATDPARHLGKAYLAQAATLEQRRALSSVREKKARALKADLKAAEKLRRTRYSATTTPDAPRPRRGHRPAGPNGDRPRPGDGPGGASTAGPDPAQGPASRLGPAPPTPPWAGGTDRARCAAAFP
ncbi:Mu transposase C-terminal domain-containing protein [Streptomyces sp. NPDC007189]|uniref:Mu transposase C-terminal domain-containing protein n=1 Tax=Streptomyces sp. NPDC007189 TaxID=3154315 RepID=UPI003452E6D7